MSLDLGAIERALLTLSMVNEVSVRVRPDGSPEAFVFMDKKSELDSASVKAIISRLLPGYSVPDPLFVRSRPFIKGPKGEVDFDAMEREIARQIAASMSDHALLVRDIVANLLLAEPAKINGDSDFFLLGGNSLLLGKLAYHLRKEMGAHVPVAALFTNSTIEGIASLVEADEKHIPNTFDDKKYHHESPNDSDDTLEAEHDHDPEDNKKRSRDQTHPVSLIVQALPLIFFYPFKTALTCESGSL